MVCCKKLELAMTPIKTMIHYWTDARQHEIFSLNSNLKTITMLELGSDTENYIICFFSFKSIAFPSHVLWVELVIDSKCSFHMLEETWNVSNDMLQSFKNGHMKMFSFLPPSPTLLCVLMQLFSIVDSFFGTNKMLLIGGTGAEV